MVNIDPTEKRDQHCKIYTETSVKKAVEAFANRHAMSFSEAGRHLMIYALDQLTGGK